MNFKTLSLSVLTTLATVATPVLAGYQYQGISLMDGSDFTGNEVLAGDMINSLNNLGIPVVDGGKEKLALCEPGENSYTMGFYVPSKNFMVICTNTTDTDEQFEVLTHEVVHVIQDARTGIDDDNLGETDSKTHYQLASNLSDDDVVTITELYDEEDWVVETEAFFYQDKPQVVANELKRWAF